MRDSLKKPHFTLKKRDWYYYLVTNIIVPVNILGISTVQGNTTSIHATIPKDVAKLLNLSPGAKVVFIEGSSGEVIIKPNGVNLLKEGGAQK